MGVAGSGKSMQWLFADENGYAWISTAYSCSKSRSERRQQMLEGKLLSDNEVSNRISWIEVLNWLIREPLLLMISRTR
jgi:gluconate kinase